MANESGQMLIYLVVILTVALLSVAVVIDIGMLYIIRVQLQTAADAAALAGVSVATERVTYNSSGATVSRWFEPGPNAASEANRIFYENLAAMTLLTSHINIRNLTVLPEGNTVQVRVEVAVKTYLVGPIIRALNNDSKFVEMNISRSATARITP